MYTRPDAPKSCILTALLHWFGVFLNALDERGQEEFGAIALRFVDMFGKDASAAVIVCSRFSNFQQIKNICELTVRN